jgi:4-hydroxybenzoyl-CoA thioesterase
VSSTGRVYRSEILIRFAYCDPAGIVFFPRYAEMFNNLVEDWCRDEIGLSFADIHLGRGWGLPTAHLEIDFISPSRVGDVLMGNLSVRSIGRSSLGLAIVLQGADGADRVRAHTVLVLTEPKSNRPTPIPDELRARLMEFHAAG